MVGSERAQRHIVQELCESPSNLDVVCFELSKLFVNSGATDIVFVTLSSTAVETATAQCISRGQWRGDTALTLPLFWRRSTVSPVFFGRFPRLSLSLSRLLPTLSPSVIGHLASVDVKQHESKQSESRGGRFGLSVLTAGLAQQ